MRGVVLLLLLIGLAGGAKAAEPAALPITTLTQGCTASSVPSVRLGSNELYLADLPSEQALVLELREHGVDVQVRLLAPDQDPDRVLAERWLDSEPEAYAVTYLAADSDPAGTLRAPLRVVAQYPWARLELVVHCLASKSDRNTEGLRRFAQIARWVAQVRGNGEEAAALSALGLIGLQLLEVPTPSRERLWLLLQLRQLASWGGLSQAEQAWLQEVIAESDALGDRVQRLLARDALGGVLLARQDHTADGIFAEVEGEAAALGLEDLAARAANGRCVMLRVAGNAEAAAECYLTSISRAVALGRRDTEADIRMTRVTALLYLGRYHDAVTEINNASNLADQLDDQSLRARVLQSRAQIARWGGDFEAALSALQAALGLYQATGQVEEIARAERHIAQTYALAQEPRRAEVFFRSALASATRRGDWGYAFGIGVELATLRVKADDFAGALALLADADAHIAASDSYRHSADNLLHKAVIEFAAGKLDLARASVARLLARQSELRWRNQYRLQALRFRVGDDTGDLDAERDLVPALDAALERGDLALFLDLAEAVLEDRMRRGQHASAYQLARRALQSGSQLAAKVRSPSLRSALLVRLQAFAGLPLWALPNGHVDASIAAAALAELEALRAIERMPSLAIQADDTLIELERLLGGSDAEQSQRSPERERLMLRLTTNAATDSMDARAVTPTPDFAKVTRGVLVYPLLRGSRAGMLTHDANGWRWVGDLDGDAVRRASRALQSTLAAGHGQREAIDAQVAQLAEALRWDSVLTEAPAQLSVVADGQLGALPWSLLPLPGDSGMSLAEGVPLVMLQSLQPHPAARVSVLHVGAAATVSDSGLPNLQAAAGELTRVAAAWPQLRVASARLTTRDELARALGSSGALIHLAAHGRGEQGRLEDAGLWMIDSPSQPSFVSALRLRQTPVKAELVVLGACESGIGTAGRTLGMGGVAGGLIDAGAGAVVATRWAVSDRAALAFADAFHRALAALPERPELALQTAVRELKNMPSMRHPTHWAGWFLLRRGP